MFAPKAFVRHHRPARRRVVKGLTITRPVPDEPLTPGLRRRDAGECMGFHAAFIGDRDDDDDDHD